MCVCVCVCVQYPYFEADVVGNVLYPHAVQVRSRVSPRGCGLRLRNAIHTQGVILSFKALFGTDLGMRALKWCKKYKFVLRTCASPTHACTLTLTHSHTPYRYSKPSLPPSPSPLPSPSPCAQVAAVLVIRRLITGQVGLTHSLMYLLTHSLT